MLRSLTILLETFCLRENIMNEIINTGVYKVWRRNNGGDNQ